MAGLKPGLGLVLLAGWLGLGTGAAAQAQLHVVSAGPVGEVARLAEAGEVRVTFSEPMVALGRIPDPVLAPFLRIEPPLAGSLRWSGTTTLVFTPRAPLPYATRFEVTVETSAASISGDRLARPFRFSFATPSLRLERAEWYRVSGRYDSPIVVALRFNQPVATASLAGELSLRYRPHAWEAPSLPAATLGRLRAADPRAPADFEAKVASARSAARAEGSLAFETAREWDEKRFPRGDDLLVLVTKAVPPPDAWIEVGLPGSTPAAETPAARSARTLRMEPTFFVLGLRCAAACDPEAWNPLRLSLHARASELRGRVAVADLTEPGQEARLVPRQAPPDVSPDDAWRPDFGDGYDYDRSAGVGLEELGFSLQPARRYVVEVDRRATSADGQSLGYTWMGPLENWHRSGFTSFGSGHGVWEAAAGPLLPYYARNLESVTEWLAPVGADDLVPTLHALQSQGFASSPAGPGAPRRLRPEPDRVQSHGLDLGPRLSPTGRGVFWVALRDGPPISKAPPAAPAEKPATRASLVQVTNLGITVKDSPLGTLVLVTRLDDGAPVAGARVAVRSVETEKAGRDATGEDKEERFKGSRVVWSGATNASGLAIATGADLRPADSYWRLSYVVTVEKDGDLAYVCSDWSEGIEPWFWGLRYDLEEAKPVLRGSVFADRGVYRLGEEVRMKALLRSDTASGMKLLPTGTKAELSLLDAQGREIERRPLALSEWSSADLKLKLPEDGPLGGYRATVKVEGQNQAVSGEFLVAAYRRPDFRVDALLAADSSLAGARLRGTLAARYLFGGAMGKRKVRFTLSRKRVREVPAAILAHFPAERFVFLGQDERQPARAEPETLLAREAELDGDGKLDLDLEGDRSAGHPYTYTLEGEVTDVSRQTLAGRASFHVDPAPWYVGLGSVPFFADAQSGIETQIVAASLSGQPAAGVLVRVRLKQVQWVSARRAEGLGYYTWESERREVEAGEWTLETAKTPVPLRLPLPSGGYFVLEASARDAEGRSTTSSTSFYALGAGYTAWDRHDHNRIEIVPEKKSYRPGEEARILVKSPWEKATALLTTEREGVRIYRTFSLASTQETLSFPITERDIPNLYVSVVLIKGRTRGFSSEDRSDPGRPAFRVGYAELAVEDRAKRLEVRLRSDRDEYRPGARARVEVAVTDERGQGGASEVTLWAVDYGVLSLTGHRAPDLLGSVYVAKALQVMTQDSRQNIVSRRVLASKGAAEGGGGGRLEGPGAALRRDFRPLAFWLGSLLTDARGRASAEVTLPESLTTYRIMAVAGDKASRFGFGERELRTSRPIVLQPAFPRFLSAGDRAVFGGVLTSRLGEKGTATLGMRSLDPGLLEIAGEPSRTVELGAGGSAEVRFEVRAKAAGRARVQMSARLLGEADAFEEILPVHAAATPEVVASYGQASPEAREALELPGGVVPGYGGLLVETASTSLVGLGEAARYLLDYPYGCAEQRASAALALVLAAELGGAFRLEGIAPDRLKQTIRSALGELESFQCEDGGFAFWKGACSVSSPYLTAYVLHVLERARSLGHPVSSQATERAQARLIEALGAEAPENDVLRPSHAAWQAFAARVLAESGRNVDSHLSRLLASVEDLPVFALADLLGALRAKGEAGDGPAELLRRIRNAVLTEGGASHVEEPADPRLLLLWSSNLRSTAIVLRSLVGAAPEDPLIPRLVRFLMQARRNGRWGNTQENALVLEALVEHSRAFEREAPAFTAVVRLGLETLARAEFRGRSTEAASHQLPMSELAKRGRPGDRLELAFLREGQGTLHYLARLRYAALEADPAAADQGFAVERSYAPARDSAALPATSFAAGELVRVTLKLTLPKERRFVAVRDPLPAGFEPVEAAFATTAAELLRERRQEDRGGRDWLALWRRGGFDHVERHDDRVQLFATRLGEGEHVFSYLARATTAGLFRAAPARAEEMYSPEVSGRSAFALIEVRP